MAVRFRGQSAVDGITVRDATEEDLGTVVRLYNDSHRDRPFTCDRDPSTWRRYPLHATWGPGRRILLAEAAGRTIGYAVLPRLRFGVDPRIIVSEIAGSHEPAVHALLLAAAEATVEAGREEFTVREPPDSIAGRILRRTGARYEWVYPAGGGGILPCPYAHQADRY